MKPNLFKQILSTVIYTVVLFFVLWGNNIFINWGLRTFILPFFGWFYGLGLMVKILLIIGLGTLMRVVLFGLFMWAAEIVSRILAYIFIFTKTAYWVSVLMVLTNFIFCSIDMWKFVQWDFWSVVIWLMLLWFVFQMNWTFVMQDKEKLEIEMAKAEAEAEHYKLRS